LGGGDQQIDRLRRAILRAASGHRHRLGRERRALAQLHATGEGVEAIFTDVAELLRLSPTVRSLLFLVDVEDLDPSRVAAAVGTTVEAVVSTTDRARASLMERIGSTDGIVRAMDRLAQRGRTPSATAVMASAERRMTAPPRPAPPARGRLETTGWRKRRADFDRNVRSMAAGAAVAVFVVCAVVVGTVMLAARG
ncbi:MAG: hypothetical protein GWN07_37805, partial [Actinobacteria bacterium]|nr:hypothetical protein [Actinomycetota bacterium]NIS36658.1 hypothetical protein [Actinomycetota bacterium]NIU71149.1 hypothetical protein [Actinomycetota bacterium]NIW33104.1 hypothetical protein [Actinomycetota bacterium]NIX25251.1 hypothetical protein [Actinomycetota bacterium]